jgi:hypothetical protein
MERDEIDPLPAPPAAVELVVFCPINPYPYVMTTMNRNLAIAVLSLGFAPAGYAGTQTFTDTFESSVNHGGWTYGPPPLYPTTGGNPGAYLRASVDTFAPMLRTTTPGSQFTGDYRGSRVTTLGVDLRTISTQFPAQRELSLVLWSGNCAVYRLGTEFVPQPPQGWKKFDIAIPAQSTTLPAGWFVHPNSACQAPNATWNQVIQNVTSIEYFYGDPTFFFIFDIWNVGADNARIVRDTDWTDLGNALAGVAGPPLLTGAGSLTAGSAIVVGLSGAKPNAPALLVTGLAQLNQPFLGGVLVPNVATTNLVVPLTTSGAGSIALPTTWPAGIPGGTTIVLQYWIADPAGPFGAAASNGLLGTAQ